MDNFRKFFATALKNNFPVPSTRMISEVERQYRIISVDTQFAATSRNPIDRRLNFSSYFLSLIKVLDQQGEPFEVIRKICLEVVTEYVRPKNKIQQFLKNCHPSSYIHPWHLFL